MRGTIFRRLLFGVRWLDTALALWMRGFRFNAGARVLGDAEGWSPRGKCTKAGNLEQVLLLPQHPLRAEQAKYQEKHREMVP